MSEQERAVIEAAIKWEANWMAARNSDVLTNDLLAITAESGSLLREAVKRLEKAQCGEYSQDELDCKGCMGPCGCCEEHQQ